MTAIYFGLNVDQHLATGEHLFHLGGREGGAHPTPKRLLQFLGNSEAQVVVVVIGHNLRNISEAQNN